MWLFPLSGVQRVHVSSELWLYFSRECCYLSPVDLILLPFFKLVTQFSVTTGFFVYMEQVGNELLCSYLSCLGCLLQTHLGDIRKDASFACPPWFPFRLRLFSLERCWGSCLKLGGAAAVVLAFPTGLCCLSLNTLNQCRHSQPPPFLSILPYASGLDLWVPRCFI